MLEEKFKLNIINMYDDKKDRAYKMKEWDIIEDLIELGKRRGYITYDEINELFTPEMVSQEEYEEMINTIQETGINIIESEEGDNFADEEIVEESDEKSQDLVQAYFHSMGDIQVLTRDEEAELARKIEEGKKIIEEIVTATPFYRKKIQELGEIEKADENIPDEDTKEEALRQTIIVLDNLMKQLSEAEAKIKRHGSLKDLKKYIQEKKKKDIKPFKLITLAKETLDIYKKISSETGMDPEEFKNKHRMLDKVVNLVTSAKEELITHNLRLVINIAKNYIGRGLSLLDLIQEGNIGLMRAIDKFDYRKGFKFSTYATWWIRQGITRAIIDQTKTIRVPVHMVEFYNKVTATAKELTQQLGKEPDIDEIAKKLGVSRSKVDDVYRAIQDPIALQTLVGDEETTLENFISDNNVNPYSDVEKRNTTEDIIKVLHTLTPKEELVIRMRFGIGFERDHTLEEVGRHLSITRERVRQIEAKAIKKLKHPTRSRALRVLRTN